MRKVIIILFLLQSFFVSAQHAGQQVWDADNGLSGSVYTTAIQDSKGTMWIGSYANGAYCFDGKKWKNYEAVANNKGLYNLKIDNIFEDDKGGIWFSHSMDLGFTRFYNNQMTQFGTPLDSSKSPFIITSNFANKEIYAINIDAFSKKQLKIYRFNSTIEKFEHYKTIYLNLPQFFGSNSNINSFYFNNHSLTIKILKNNVYYIFQIIDNQIKLYYKYSDNIDVTTAIDEDGYMYGHCKTGAITLNNKGKISHILPPILKSDEVALKFRTINHTNISTEKKLITCWQVIEKNNHQHRFLIAEYDLRQKKYTSLVFFETSHYAEGIRVYKDKMGYYWVLTAYSVIRVFPEHYFVSSQLSNMVSSLWAVAQTADGHIWGASYGNGLVEFDGLAVRKLSPKMKGYTHFDDNGISDKEGNVYFNLEKSESSGILKFNSNGSKITQLMPGLCGFYLDFDNQGQLIRGVAGRGLWVLKKGKSGMDTTDNSWLKIDFHKGLKFKNAICGLQDKHNRYWIGHSIRGVAVYFPEKDYLVQWVKVDNPQNFGVMSMCEDKRGNLWFGSEKGLYFFENRTEIDNNFELRKYLIPVANECDKAQGLITVCRIINDSTLLVGNDKGFATIDLKAWYTGKLRIYPYDKNNGYLGGGINQNGSFLDREGNVWVATTKGIAKFHPNLSPKDTLMPIFHIDSVKAGANWYYSNFSNLKFSQEQNYFKVFFSHDINPMLLDNIRFQYRLNPLDSAWSALSDINSLEYVGLASSCYSLEIRAWKNGMVTPVQIVSFRITPPLWSNPLFWLGIISSLIIIGVLLFRYERKLKDQQIVLERNKVEVAEMSKEKNRLQVQAIVNQLNPHFINNALQWLQMRLGDDPEAVSVLGRLSVNIGMVFKTSRNKQAFHSLKHELLLAENYLYIQKTRFKQRLHYVLPNAESISVIEKISVPLMFIQIHVENAIEHGIRNKINGVGEVSIEVNQTIDYVTISITDNGIGREIAKKIGSKGTQNGVQMLEELIEIYNQSNPQKLSQIYEDNILFDNTTGNSYGTRVVLKIPKNYVYEI